MSFHIALKKKQTNEINASFEPKSRTTFLKNGGKRNKADTYYKWSDMTITQNLECVIFLITQVFQGLVAGNNDYQLYFFIVKSD